MTKKIKTSAIMRAIVADASRPGEQRDAASKVLSIGSQPTWLRLYNRFPYTLAVAAGWSEDRANEPVKQEAPRIKAVHDDLVKLARRYRIKPTEDA